MAVDALGHKQTNTEHGTSSTQRQGTTDNYFFLFTADTWARYSPPKKTNEFYSIEAHHLGSQAKQNAKENASHQTSTTGCCRVRLVGIGL